MIVKLVAVLVVIGLALGGWTLWIGHRPYEIQVYVQSADRLVSGNDVRLGGITVGQVRGVQLAPDSGEAGAILDLEIDPRAAPLRQGDRVVLRPEGLLGTNYVQIDPVSSGPFIPDGGTIPLQDTSSQVTLDQIQNVFTPSVRAELRTLIRQSGVALNGTGPDINEILDQLPQISGNLASTTGALDEETAQLGELQQEFARLASMASSEDTALRGDLGNGATLLNTVADHQQALQGTLTHASSSLGEANAALAGNQQNVNQLLKELPSLLDALEQFQTGATTTAGVINPCMGNLLITLQEMQSATSYNQPAGSSDGQGAMLRIDPELVDASGAQTGSFSPSAACSGSGG